MRSLRVRSGHIVALTYAPDGRSLVARAEPWCRLWLWDLIAGQPHLIRSGGSDESTQIALSADHLAYVGNGAVRLRDRDTDTERYFVNRPEHQCDALAFAPDGRTVVFAGHDSDPLTFHEQRVVRLGDATTGRIRVLPVPLPPRSRARGMAADGSLVLWASDPVGRGPTPLTVWHVPTRLKLADLRLASEPTAVAFSRSGRQLALGAGDIVLVYDLSAPVAQVNAELHGTPWAPLTLPLRRRRIAARMPAVPPPRALEGHTGAVLSLAFTPDEASLFSGGRDATVRHWDVASGRLVAAWDWSVGVVYSLAVAPDGMTAAAGGNVGRTLIWDLD